MRCAYSNGEPGTELELATIRKCMLPHTATTTDGLTYLLQIHEVAGQRESPDTTAPSSTSRHVSQTELGLGDTRSIIMKIQQKTEHIKKNSGKKNKSLPWRREGVHLMGYSSMPDAGKLRNNNKHCEQAIEKRREEKKI